MKRLLYSILLLQCILFWSCNTGRQVIGPDNLTSLKLTESQELQQNIKYQCIDSVSGEINPDSEAYICNDTSVLNFMRANLKSHSSNKTLLGLDLKNTFRQIQKRVPDQIKQLITWPSAAVVKSGNDDSNPYTIPWVISLLSVIGLIILGFTASELYVFGLMITIALVAFIAFLTFVILSFADENRDNDPRTRNIIYCLSWIFLGVAALLAQAGGLSIYFGFPIDMVTIIFFILALAFLAFFILWLVNVIKYFNQAKKTPQDKEKIKSYLNRLIITASFICWLISIIISIIAFSTNIYMAVIFAGIFIGTFVIWLLKVLKNRKKANADIKKKT